MKLEKPVREINRNQTIKEISNNSKPMIWIKFRFINSRHASMIQRPWHSSS
jgi:hypothetical protein